MDDLINILPRMLFKTGAGDEFRQSAAFAAWAAAAGRQVAKITAPVRLGNAILRNRLKRRLREVFRLRRESIPGGWDIVLNPRQGAAKISFPALERELMRLFPQARPVSPATGATPGSRPQRSA